MLLLSFVGGLSAGGFVFGLHGEDEINHRRCNMKLGKTHKDLGKTPDDLDSIERTVAHSLVLSIAFSARERGASKKGQIGFVFDALMQRYPKSGWTFRRIQSIWAQETKAVIRARELRELVETKHDLAEASRLHADYKAETARIRARYFGVAEPLAVQDKTFGEPDVAGLRSLARNMDNPRTGEGE